MDPQDAIDFSREALTMVAVVGGPILAAGLAIGLIVGIFQAMTQIQDQTVSAVPKMLGMLLVTIMVLPWVGEAMVEYTRETLGTPMIGATAPVATIDRSPFQFASATTHLTPAYTDRPIARVANLPPMAMPSLNQTTTMPALRSEPTSMPIHPYSQTPNTPAVNGSSMPQFRRHDLPEKPVKQINREG